MSVLSPQNAEVRCPATSQPQASARQYSANAYQPPVQSVLRRRRRRRHFHHRHRSRHYAQSDHYPKDSRKFCLHGALLVILPMYYIRSESALAFALAVRAWRSFEPSPSLGIGGAETRRRRPILLGLASGRFAICATRRQGRARPTAWQAVAQAGSDRQTEGGGAQSRALPGLHRQAFPDTIGQRPQFTETRLRIEANKRHLFR